MSMKSLKSYITKAQKNTVLRKQVLAQFIDDFSSSKDLQAISKKVLGKDKVSQLFIAAAHQLTINLKLKTPKWMQSNIILKDPYFVSQFEEFKLLTLRDSPYAFRIRNIFVTANFLDRR